MARVVTVAMNNLAFCAMSVCVLPIVLSSLTPAAVQGNSNQCPVKIHTCQCLYGNSEDVDVSTEPETRTVGLAAATGALGGILATGAALATYLHFRGTGGGGGGGISGGGGRGSSDWQAPRAQRPESVASSSEDSYESQSPLTKRDRKGFALETRGRPFTGASTTSNVTNIYRHSRVWPGHSNI